VIKDRQCSIARRLSARNNKKMAQRGIFITFEGVEGAGKTTQARRLAEALGPNVILTREPGGTPISERIRDLFLTSEGITAATELLLIAAARAQHVDEFIRPALETNQIVICDRFIDATVAYQGYRGGIDLELIHQLNRTATGGLMPDLTFVLDLPPEIGLQRQQQGEAHRDRLDREPLESHHKVREGYLSVAKAEPHRVKLIDATQSPDAVHAALLTEYQEFISK
jgi:dTMP kinase